MAAEDGRPGWSGGPVPAEHSLRGFHHVALAVEATERTAELMTDTLGFRRVEETEGRIRLSAGEGGPGSLVDVVNAAGFPMGAWA